MVVTRKKHKFPKFMAKLTEEGLSIGAFANLVNQKGHTEYNRLSIQRRLNGTTSLDYEDIIIFSEVLEVDESIFFN